MAEDRAEDMAENELKARCALLREWAERYESAERASLMEKPEALAELLRVQQRINIEQSRELAAVRAHCRAIERALIPVQGNPGGTDG